MKHLILLLAVFTAVNGYTQVPEAFQYQAVVRDSEGAIRSEESISVDLAILQGAVDGSVAYSENHEVTTNQNGLIHVMIGMGNSTDDFSAIDWSSGPYFLEVTIDGSVMGTSQLLSVPYAKYAEMSGDAFSGQYPDLSGKPDLSDTTNWDKAYAWGDHRAMVEELLHRIKMLEDMSGVDTLEDQQGNVYKTVRIGGKVWMAENLRATHYAGGSEITGRYWFETDINGDNEINAEDSALYVDTYGFLYDWNAVMNGASSSDTNPSGVQGVCPDGWHVPGKQEWEMLRDTLGGYDVAGGKLKEAGSEHWNSPNVGATNETGFTGLPGGNRAETGFFYQWGYNAYYQTSTEYTATDSYVMRFFDHNDNMSTYFWEKASGASVRCVKNQ